MAKPDEKEAARALRRKGLSINEIAAQLGVSKSSASLWVRDLKLSNDQRLVLKTRAQPGSLPPNVAPDVPASLHPQLTVDDTRRGFRYHHTKSKGDVAEAMVLAVFAVHGYGVLRPFSENSPYDMVVDDGKRLAKVQVKHARLLRKEGVVSFATASNSQHAQRLYSESDCDFFAAWCADLGTMYIVSRASTGNRT
jgi:hypothetical protein